MRKCRRVRERVYYLASGGERERLAGCSGARRGDLLRERDTCREGESVGAADWLRARGE